jgi:hypothetical protein
MGIKERGREGREGEGRGGKGREGRRVSMGIKGREEQGS